MTTPDIMYKQAHDLHYLEDDTNRAKALYEIILVKYPKSKQADWAKTQIENIKEAERIAPNYRKLFAAMPASTRPAPVDTPDRHTSKKKAGSIETLSNKTTILRNSSTPSQRLALAIGIPVLLALVGIGIMSSLHTGTIPSPLKYSYNPFALKDSWLGWSLILVIILIFEWHWLKAPPSQQISEPSNRGDA